VEYEPIVVGKQRTTYHAAKGTRGLAALFSIHNNNNDNNNHEQEAIHPMQQPTPAPIAVPMISAIDPATIQKQQRNNAIKHLKNVEGMLKDGTLFKDMNAEPDDDVNYNKIVDDEVRDRRSLAYMPKPGSAISSYLSGIYDDMKNHRNKIVSRSLSPKSGIHWIAPTTADPVATASVKASDWYLHNCWIYKWMPIDQYNLDLSKIKCHFCESADREQKGLEKNITEWRLMICLDKIAWVLHGRHRCKNVHCRKIMAEIDSKFMSELLTRIADWFEFVTTLSGPDLHQSLVYLLVPLLEKTVMFGTFAKIINEVHTVHYTKNHVSHLDSLHNLKEGLHTAGKELDLFTAQHDTKGYCSIRLSEALLKASMFTLLSTQENYMQMLFQTVTDAGAQKDETHKFSSTIRLQGVKRKVFTASTTVLSKSVLINMSRLRFTKSNDELKDIIKQWKEVRENDGIMELLRLETDNPHADPAFWESIFDSLLKYVVPCVWNAPMTQSLFVQYERKISERSNWLLMPIMLILLC
jgi:hypothetical protein